MSFIWKADQPLRTPEEVAAIVRTVAEGRGLGDVYVHACLSCIKVESDFWCPWNANARGSNSFPYDSQSDDGRSVGYYQQQTGPAGELWWGPVSSEMDLASATAVFLSKMPDGLDYSMGRDALGTAVANTQQCAPAYRGRYAEEWDGVAYLVGSAATGTAPIPEPAPTPAPPVQEPPVATSTKPSYNEFPIWSPNNQSRAGQDVTLFLLHTQEPLLDPPPDNAAEALGNYCADPTPQVSYHYYASQASDGGVTVVDGVDTDLASWSVGDDNNRAINLCFAGSSVDWSRDQWMKYAGNAIDVAAYIAIQDIAKYPKLPSTFIGTGGDYLPGVEAGVSDHEFVTDVDHWGTHKDVGPNFPKDVFAARLAYWAGAPESQAPPPVEPPPVVVQPPSVEDFLTWVTDRKNTTDRDLLEYMTLQIGTGHPAWPTAGKTVRDQVFGR